MFYYARQECAEVTVSCVVLGWMVKKHVNDGLKLTRIHVTSECSQELHTVIGHCRFFDIFYDQINIRRVIVNVDYIFNEFVNLGGETVYLMVNSAVWGSLVAPEPLQ